MTRSDLIVSLGGGVAGDISGFVASTYLRGINYVQIPTSLLAQIDSSIGGKSGVNSEYGKNLIGTFWQPSLVIIDPQLLLTLPKSQFQNGMAEAIKYGCIKNIDLLYRINNEQPKDFISDLIFECVKIKKDIVCKDEYDKGYRMILNFGHTVGHAIEKLYKYDSMCHGQAISIGMCIVTNISERMGITKKYTYNYLKDTLKKYSLPIHSNFPINTISENIIYDKKLYDNILNLILIKEFGTPYIYKISSNKIKDFLKEYKYE